MAIREMIISGSVGTNDPDSQVEPLLRQLLGKFVDDLDPAEKALYEYTQVACLGDLWLAYWDDVRLELWIMPSTAYDGNGDMMPKIRVANPPTGGPKRLLPALNLLMMITEVN